MYAQRCMVINGSDPKILVEFSPPAWIIVQVELYIKIYYPNVASMDISDYLAFFDSMVLQLLHAQEFHRRIEPDVDRAFSFQKRLLWYS
ncbi:MAG TPA: hypothetical protein VGE63_00615 [Candidatus Paceibacterota bacterium]